MVGTADGSLFNGASIANGVLQLGGVNDYMRTQPIDGARSRVSALRTHT